MKLITNGGEYSVKSPRGKTGGVVFARPPRRRKAGAAP